MGDGDVNRFRHHRHVSDTLDDWIIAILAISRYRVLLSLDFEDRFDFDRRVRWDLSKP